MCSVNKIMDKFKNLWSKMNRWHKGFLIFFIVESRIIPGAQMGFTCGDPALSHPFAGDTITWKHLFGTIILLPLAVILLVERDREKSIDRRKQALRWYKEYLFGILVNLVVVQTIKLAVGAPRPHFFDSCSPNEALTCQGSEYVPQYTCSKAGWLTQSDRSFPSGHTSLAIHSGLFLIYYLHKRTVHSTAVLTSQVVLLLATVYCCISRMIDHRHHWWDVLAGAGIGVPILLYTIFNLCCNFETKAPSEEYDISNQTNLYSTDATHLVDTKTT